MNQTKQNPVKRILGVRGMRGALTAFAGLIVIYIAFGIINPTVFSGQNVMNLLRSMSKYLIIGIGQSYILITGKYRPFHRFRGRHERNDLGDADDPRA